MAPFYREPTLWWPGYYDYAPGQWGSGFPRYGAMGGVPDITATKDDDGGSSLLSEAGDERTDR
jgi:hypothetical protein